MGGLLRFHRGGGRRGNYAHAYGHEGTGYAVFNQELIQELYQDGTENVLGVVFHVER